MTFEIRTRAWAPGARIPRRHTADGEDHSPPLDITGAPPGTRSFALIFDDPDAQGGTWVHWVLYDDPGETRALSGEVPRSGELPNGIRQGRNSWGDIGYRGPDPPAGPEHRYYLHALAVSAALDLPPGADATQVRAAARPRILAEARYLGTYGRP